LTSRRINLPNFFIVGAPKAGTTSLYFYLDQHPEIYMCPVKETHYFADEFRMENFSEDARPKLLRERRELEEYLLGDMSEKRFGALVSSWDDYVRLFDNAGAETAIGEATPGYLWSRTAARNIARRIPDARIIVSLRSPVDRAYSQYLHMVTNGSTRSSFADLVQQSLSGGDRYFGPSWPFLEFGRYFEQLQRYLTAFPRSQIHVLLYEDLEQAPEMVMTEIFDFLGVRRNFQSDVSVRYLEPRVPRFSAAAYYLKRWRIWPFLARIASFPGVGRVRSLLFRPRESLTVGSAEWELLVGYYRDDIEKLAVVINRDLSAWLKPHAG
jgi:hypothetical protein